MYELTVSSKFSAAHRIMEYNGSCERLHGHTWKVDLFLRNDKLNSLGLMLDFRDIKKVLNKLLDELDHTFLNEHPYFKDKNPTAENLAKFIYDRVKKEFSVLYKVSVWESENTAATYYEV